MVRGVDGNQPGFNKYPLSNPKDRQAGEANNPESLYETPYTPDDSQYSEPAYPSAGSVFKGYLGGIYSNIKGKVFNSGGYGNPSTGQSDVKDVDYRQLSLSERKEVSGLDDRQRAVLHLWGRQNMGRNPDSPVFDSVYDAVMYAIAHGNKGPSGESYTDAEIRLVKELRAKELKEFGFVSGRELDREFFKIMKQVSGEDLSALAENAPLKKASGKPLKFAMDIPASFDKPEFEASLTQQSGLSAFSLSIMAQWAHDLLDDGKVNNTSTLRTLTTDKALDRGAVREDQARRLIELDVISSADGKTVDGDSLQIGFRQLLERLYGKVKTEPTVESVKKEVTAQAVRQGTPLAVIRKNMLNAKQGANIAIQQFRDLLKKNPAVTAGVSLGMIGAAGVCPFFAGTLVAGATAVAFTQGQNYLKNS